jgi:hypothetical protein
MFFASFDLNQPRLLPLTVTYLPLILQIAYAMFIERFIFTLVNKVRTLMVVSARPVVKTIIYGNFAAKSTVILPFLHRILFDDQEFLTVFCLYKITFLLTMVLMGAMNKQY